MSWEQAWQEGRTGWDRGQAAPPLLEYLEAHPTTGTPRALIPGCGAGYDVFALAAAGFEATGLDIAPTAGARFAQLHAQQPQLQGNASILIADFFSEQEVQGPFDVIWDYTFLCAIDPTLRESWAKRMSELLASDGELVTLIFPVLSDELPASDAPGPPYPLHPELVKPLLAPYFSLHSIARPAHSHPERANKEWLARWRKL